ncbi:transcriptional regulator, GntR family [Granulicatella balaenopterae]|uniref:Trehalose operon repressor n=2 Tax=Granulicatella balaenopterae TaxID=137733 RepID=A0A1H9LN68_9LACT|nr:transcriptional regulator, GntR family [Granulicatella balaenopterae]
MKLHEKIYFELKEKIESGTYPVGSLLPSEHELVANFQVSRETIRKALRNLLEHGYIQKKQGKGSIVLDVKRYNFPVSGLVSFKELQAKQAIPSRTIVVKNERVKAPKHLVEAGLVTEDEEMILLVRQREINGEVIILDKDYIKCLSKEMHLPNEQMAISLYDYLEGDIGLLIAYAKKEFNVEPITKEDCELMALGQDTHVVVVRSEVFLEDTSFIQYSESRHRLDKFKFVDFARRQHA